MKKILLIFIIICFSSCHNNKLNIDKTEIIGKKIDMNNLPYGSIANGYYDTSIINGKEYNSFVTYYKNRCLVYTYDNSIIIDFHSTNLVHIFRAMLIYLKAKLPFHDDTDYSYVIRKLGQPVATYKASEMYSDGPKIDDYIVATYCQKYRNYFGDLSLSKNTFFFEIDGKLVSVWNEDFFKAFFFNK